jgi:hypothetical protein
MPPPELHFGRWRESIARLKALKFSRIAPTHFGIFDDAQWQLTRWIRRWLDVEKWLEIVMAQEPSIEDLRESFSLWMQEQGSGKI